MSAATICPKLFCIWHDIEPHEFEQLHIIPIREHLSQCEIQDTPLNFSAHILSLISQKSPWDRMHDQNWKGWLIDWMNAILPELQKASTTHDPVSIETHPNGCTLDLEPEILGMWHAFLQRFANGPSANNKFLKGIGANHCLESCSQTPPCSLFFLVPEVSWRIVKYPWILRYSPDLPTEGTFPFLPPDNWPGAALHGDQHGYLDKDGNQWRKDPLHHQNHWDVQLVAGGYHNVTFQGTIL